MRLLHRSFEGDDWLLIKEPSGDVWIEHRGKPGSAPQRIGLDTFLRSGEGPQREELVRLIGTLVDQSAAGPETT